MSLKPRNTTHYTITTNESTPETQKRIEELSKKIHDIKNLEVRGNDTFIDILITLKKNLDCTLSDLNSATKLIHVLNLVSEYSTTITCIKLTEQLIHTNEDSIKRSVYFMVSSSCIEFKPESPILEFDEVTIPYLDKDMPLMGTLNYFYIPNGHTITKYIQKVKKEILTGADPEFQQWCKFSVSHEDFVNKTSAVIMAKADNFTNKLEKFFQHWEVVGIHTMVLSNRQTVPNFTAIVEVINDKNSCYKRIHLRQNVLTVRNKDSVGDFSVESILININQNTTYELVTVEDFHHLKIQTDSVKVELRFHNKDEVFQMINALKEFKDAYEDFGISLVTSFDDTFKCVPLLQRAIENPITFFDNVGPLMF